MPDEFVSVGVPMTTGAMVFVFFILATGGGFVFDMVSTTGTSGVFAKYPRGSSTGSTCMFLNPGDS